MTRPEAVKLARLAVLVFKTGFASAPAGFLVTGDFTLRGTTGRISVPLTARLSDGTLRATGAFDFNQSDFGVTPVSLFLGSVRNQDRVHLVFDLIATP